METLSLLGGGFAEAVTPLNLLLCLTGVILGTVVGVLPGLGTAMAIALLVPVTFQLDPTGAFIMFAGVYFGGQFGGATTAILLNTPGQSSSMATAFEGFLMAKNRRAPQALATAVLGSFLSSIVAVTLVVFFSPLMVNLAVGFGPPEYFALTVLAFLATSAVVTGDMLRGLSSLGIGLAVAMVGIDEQSGAVRFTLGSTQLLDGISVVVVTVGLLAIGEVLHVASRSRRAPATETVASGRPWLSRRDLTRSWRPWLRGTALGIPFGVIPAGGAEIPTFLSYGTEKSLSRRRGDDEFDHGAIEGVAGPEAANNATTATSLVPLLGLGLPTSATAAIMLGAFQQYGMRPGPLLFTQESDLVWALLASLFIGSAMLLVLNLPFAPVWAKLLRIPRNYLYAGIVVFATLGVYTTRSSVFDVLLLYVIGALGFLLRRYGFPIAPVLIGVILGPLAETSLRRAMAMSQGDVGALVDSPFAVAIYSILVLAVVVSLVLRARNRRRAS
ncbi:MULTISPECIES: tripartite tricarboxylate transporter permease [unclassified Actinopolyspora]|uniref:tripartite tricarboxylate transporter permease n=1 Tax=unclassified Actinopolyspora TaxID=2639451 RepID=UPI0013F60216|nr:tripartite tricarboxylate transporter permease [Actinopolyspora sp. BKK2]NHE77643.1 tripartite tricarboxylate transporter permease [Actinopolyspora sp. BKK1]